MKLRHDDDGDVQTLGITETTSHKMYFIMLYMTNIS